MGLSTEVLEYIEELKKKGFSVVVLFSNDQLNGLDPEDFQEELYSIANNLIHAEDYDDEPVDFRDDVEADADALKSIGWGTDEDYGYADEVL